MKRVSLLAIFFLVLSFGSAQAEEILTWQDCIKESVKNNPDLVSAKESVNQLKALKAQTASVYYPQVTASAAGSRSKASGTTVDSYSYGLDATQLIFDGFKTANDVKTAVENINAGQQAYLFSSTEVRLRLRTAFVNLLRAQEAIKVTQDIADIRRSNLELITLRYESGLEHRGALLTAEADLDQANFQVAQAKRDVELAQTQLTKEMGRKNFTPVVAKGDFEVSDSAKEKPDLEALAKIHPSLLQAAAKKNAAAFGINSAYASFYPEVTGQAGMGKKGTTFLPQDSRWNYGLALSLPIFEGGLRLAQVAQAKALLNQTEADERTSHDNIVETLEEMWVSLQDAMEIVNVQQKVLVATEERSNIAEAQYSIGLISYDNWTIIEDNLVQAKSTFLNAQANALIAEANWIQAKGETLEYAQK